MGQTRSTVYTGANQAASVTDALGRPTKFEYDPAGNVKTVTDPNNQSTRFEHDPTFNRVTKITDALNQLTSCTHDPANGNLLTVTAPLNHVTIITYNHFGQPASRRELERCDAEPGERAFISRQQVALTATPFQRSRASTRPTA